MKLALQQGDLGEFTKFVQERACEDDLIDIREQKLLFAIRDPGTQLSAISAFRGALERNVGKCINAQLFLDFVWHSSNAIRLLHGECEKKFDALKGIGLVDLLDICESQVDSFTKSLSMEYKTQYETQLCETQQVGKMSSRTDAYETYLQMVSGQIKDVVFAAARTLNEASRHCSPLSRFKSSSSAINRATESFSDLMAIASKWNSIDYAIDKVSFGDWKVSRIDLTVERPTIFFDEADFRLAKARVIGLRRQLVWFQHLTKVSRGTRTTLLTLASSFIEAAHQTYGAYIGKKIHVHRKVLQKVAHHLESISLDDDLLVSIAPDVFAKYVAGLSLRCFRDTAKEHVESLSLKRRKATKRFSIMLDDIAKTFSDISGLRVALKDALQDQVITLPVKNYLDLVSNPFFLFENSEVHSTSAFDSTAWIDHIRHSSVVGGKRTDTFGKEWENLVTSTMKEFGWEILGTGIKIKADHKIVTDIDILAVWDGLVIVIQVKAFARSGINTYEQWLSRQKIVEGSKQARLAVETLLRDENLLKGLMRGQGPVNTIQPLVVTNSPYFGGWVTNGVPVASVGDLLSILKGAKVEFKTARNSLAIESQCHQGYLDSAEFLRFLLEPVSWCIADEGDRVEHIQATNGHLSLFFPEIVRRSFPVRPVLEIRS